MITRKALKASVAARQGQSSQVKLMKEGEKARRQRLTINECPYKDEADRECWIDGFNDVVLGNISL